MTTTDNGLFVFPFSFDWDCSFVLTGVEARGDVTIGSCVSVSVKAQRVKLLRALVLISWFL